MITNKKGMGVEQVFIFIVAGITLALIMIFGYKAAAGFLEKGQQVEFVSFKNDLENSIKRIYTEFGSIRNEDYHLPPGYSQICFVDMDYQATSAEIQSLCSHDQRACTLWEDAQEALLRQDSGYDAVEENVFLKPVAPVPIKVYVITIAPHQGYLCLPVQEGTFSLRLEGKGSHTQIASALALAS